MGFFDGLVNNIRDLARPYNDDDDFERDFAPEDVIPPSPVTVQEPAKQRFVLLVAVFIATAMKSRLIILRPHRPLNPKRRRIVNLFLPVHLYGLMLSLQNRKVSFV